MQTITVVKPGDSFDLWHSATCRQFSLTECSKAAGRDFKASVSIRQFGDLALNTIWSKTRHGEVIQVARRHSDIRRDQRDYFMLWHMLAGTASLSQDGRSARLLSGDMVIQDQSRPFELELGELSHASMIMIPRPLLTSRMPRASNMSALRVPGNSQLGAFAGRLVDDLFRLDDVADERAERHLGSSVLDIVLTALQIECGETAIEARAEKQLRVVKQFILAHLHDCDLDVDTIARTRNISSRQLYRLFAHEGSTPMGWLWEQRLAMAHKALSEGRRVQVTEIALNCGFRDVSHFSRSFKVRFGLSPSEIRRGQPIDHPRSNGLSGKKRDSCTSLLQQYTSTGR